MAKIKLPRPKKFDANKLKIRKTPMIRRSLKRVKVGKNFKLGFTNFISKLFQINEVNPRSKKMTDAEIARQIRAEYSHDPKILARFDPNRDDLSLIVSTYRSEFNRGRLVQSSPPPKPEMVSFQYDENGDAVNPRFMIPRPYSEEEKRKIRDKYEPYRLAYIKSREAARKAK